MTLITNRARGGSLIVAPLAATAALWLADAARERDGVTRIDPQVAHGVLIHRSTVATAIAQRLTFIGSEAVVALVMLGILVILIERRRLVHAAVVAVGMLGSAVMTVGIKLAVERPRPPAVDRLGPVDHSFSFPSGHTLSSAVAVGLIAMTYVPAMRSRARRLGAISAALLVVGGIGASRVYLGYHWSTDVVASWILAIAWLVAMGLLLTTWTRRPPIRSQSGHGSYGRSMIAVLTPLLLSLGPAALLLVMGIVFAETGLLAGFFLPGDSLLFLAGALVASHVIAVPFGVVATGVFVAAAAGDQVGYLIGRRLGPRVFVRTDSRWFAASHAARAQAFFDRHGPRAVVIARFVPVVRTFVPVVAGVGLMPRRCFTTYNLLGALVWTVGIVTAGALFGGVPFVARHIELITIGLAAFSIVPAAITVVHRRSTGARAGESAATVPTT